MYNFKGTFSAKMSIDNKQKQSYNLLRKSQRRCTNLGDFIDYDSKIEENMPLVYFVINRYWPDHTRDEDYIQTGRIALWRSLQYYDSSSGRFSTYAYTAIYRAIRRLRDNEERQFPRGKIISLDDNPGLSEIAKALDVQRSLSQTKVDDSAILICAIKSMDDIIGVAGVSNKDVDTMRMWLDGMSYDDIGRRFGITRQAVGIRVKKVQKAMRQVFMSDCTKNP